MARKRRGRPVHGWLALDKPAGMTSTTAVGRVRRLFDAQKAGHGGTLDPLATGILPIALGEATKTVAYAMDGEKTYQFGIRWGEARDTDDAEGKIVETSDLRPDRAAIEAALPGFVGEIEQVPPAFSAIKVDGARAYDLARDGAPPVLAPRQVTVHGLRLIDMPEADRATFEMTCGKGTYVRSLARDLARTLGTVGYVVDLRRTRVGAFSEATAISLAKLEAFGHIPARDGTGDALSGGDGGADDVLALLLPIETALDDIPALAMTGREADRLKSGQPVPVLRTENRDCIADLSDGATLCAMSEGKPIALVRLQDRMVHPVRVLNL